MRQRENLSRLAWYKLRKPAERVPRSTAGEQGGAARRPFSQGAPDSPGETHLGQSPDPQAADGEEAAAQGAIPSPGKRGNGGLAIEVT